jgi:hypothetical protein
MRWRIDGLAAHLLGASLALAAGVLRLILDEIVPETTARYVIFIPPVVAAAIMGGIGPGITATFVSAVIGFFAQKSNASSPGPSTLLRDGPH